MPNCENCGSLMVRVDMYDSDGTVPLKMVVVEEKSWACVNAICPDGTQNQKN